MSRTITLKDANGTVYPKTLGATSEGVVSFTLLSTGWGSQIASSYYEQTVSVTPTGVLTSTGNGICGIATTATKEQYDAAASAQLLVVAQAENSVTVRAFGDLPSVNIPCTIIVLG